MTRCLIRSGGALGRRDTAAADPTARPRNEVHDVEHRADPVSSVRGNGSARRGLRYRRARASRQVFSIDRVRGGQQRRRLAAQHVRSAPASRRNVGFDWPPSNARRSATFEAIYLGAQITRSSVRTSKRCASATAACRRGACFAHRSLLTSPSFSDAAVSTRLSAIMNAPASDASGAMTPQSSGPPTRAAG